jgi:hypothetical protein
VKRLDQVIISPRIEPFFLVRDLTLAGQHQYWRKPAAGPKLFADFKAGHVWQLPI